MSARAAKPTPGLTLGAVPRANLLPPEVHERVKTRRTRGYLVLLVVIVFLVTSGGYAFATIQAITAQAGLAAAQSRTSELLQEKATYADVIAASGAIALITTTREQATSTEVMWGEFILEELGKAMPGVVIQVNKITANAPPPWVSPLQATGPLREPRVATFVLRYLTATPPDATALSRAFESMDGVADIAIDLIEITEDPAGYATTITINLTADALSDRWSEEQATEDEANEEGAPEGDEPAEDVPAEDVPAEDEGATDEG